MSEKSGDLIRSQLRFAREVFNNHNDSPQVHAQSLKRASLETPYCTISLGFAPRSSDLTTGIQQLLVQVTNSIIPQKYQENCILLLLCCLSAELSYAKKHIALLCFLESFFFSTSKGREIWSSEDSRTRTNMVFVTVKYNSATKVTLSWFCSN